MKNINVEGIIQIECNNFAYQAFMIMERKQNTKKIFISLLVR